MSVAEWTGWWQHQRVVDLFPLSEAGEHLGTISPFFVDLAHLCFSFCSCLLLSVLALVSFFCH